MPAPGAQFTAALRDLAALAARVADTLGPQLDVALGLVEDTVRNGGTLFFCGNGGSAADAQHLAAELSGRYLVDRPGLPAVALTTNSSAVTAIGNDYGYDEVFSRQLQGIGRRGDVLVAITTSGGSANVSKAVEMARRLGMIVIGMTGMKGTAFARRCDFALTTPHAATPRVQEGHIAMGHAWCELIERALFQGRPPAPTAKRPSARGATARPRARRRSGSRR